VRPAPVERHHAVAPDFGPLNSGVNRGVHQNETVSVRPSCVEVGCDDLFTEPSVILMWVPRQKAEEMYDRDLM
jgi:hypothetical protein